MREPDVAPYDLAIFDEAHKLSARLEDGFTLRRTDRYKLAEALAGVHSVDPDYRLPWSCRHLLLLTATPHMGKDFPYYCLWRLLEPEVLSTKEAFDAYPPRVAPPATSSAAPKRRWSASTARASFPAARPTR